MDKGIKTVEIPGGRQVFNNDRLILTILLNQWQRVRLIAIAADGSIRSRGTFSPDKVESVIKGLIEKEIAGPQKTEKREIV